MTSSDIFEKVRAAMEMAADAPAALAAIKDAILPIFSEDQQTVLKESYASARVNSDTAHAALQREAAAE